MAPTIETVREFVKKNVGLLHIKRLSQYDPHSDSMVEENIPWRQVVPMEDNEYNFGVPGAFFVGEGQDTIVEHVAFPWKGYTVENSLGSFIVAVPMTVAEAV